MDVVEWLLSERSDQTKLAALLFVAAEAVVGEMCEDGRLKLVWEERGGPQVAQPERRGFGLRLIEYGLAREISGQVHLDFRPEGLICTWDMKL